VGRAPGGRRIRPSSLEVPRHHARVARDQGLRLCYNLRVMIDDQIDLEWKSESKAASSGPNDSLTGRQRLTIIVAALGLVAFIALAVAGFIYLTRDPARAANFRDIFIILMAFESLLIGLALIILIVQIARLTSLLQNEVRPILRSTNETLNTLRGTTRFLSNNLVDPVVKANSSMAAFRRVLELLRIGRPR